MESFPDLDRWVPQNPARRAAPGSVAESNALWREAQAAMRSEMVNARFVTSTMWDVAEVRFGPGRRR